MGVEASPNLKIEISFSDLEAPLLFGKVRGEVLVTAMGWYGAKQRIDVRAPISIEKRDRFYWVEFAALIEAKIKPLMEQVVGIANPVVHGQLLSEIVNQACEQFLQEPSEESYPRLLPFHEDTVQQMQTVTDRLGDLRAVGSRPKSDLD